jgi:hypothetical protein
MLTQNDDPNDVKPIPIKRDLQMIYDKYSFHNEENTVVISNFKNEIEEYQSNEIILPLYDPLKGTTDFLDDKHLIYLDKYITGLYAMDYYAGKDVRSKLNSISYDKFIQKLTKKVKYDSHHYDRKNANQF